MNKKVTSIFAYLGLIFWLIGFLAGDKEEAKFHLNQGLVLIIANFALGVLAVIPIIGIIAGIASFVYGHFHPLSTQRKIVLVTKTVVAKITPPTREYVAVCKVRARYKRNVHNAKEIPP